jgi:hypothetical protein
MLPANNDVRALALSPDGSTLFAGGSFSAVNGLTHKHLAAIQVANHSFVSPWKGTASGMVRDLAVSPDGTTLFAGGTFTNADGVASRGIAALNAATGTRTTTFDHSVDVGVMGLALTPDALLLSGTFTQVDGEPRASVAAISLSDYSLSPWAPRRFCSGCDTYWDVQTDGTWAYVASSGSGGNFAAFNLVTGDQRWGYLHADGDVQAVWLPGDGKAYVGGHFGQQIASTASSKSAVPATLLAAVDLSTGLPDTSFSPRIYKTFPGVWTLNSTTGKLWVGGDFTGELANGVNNHKPYLAAYPVG